MRLLENEIEDAVLGLHLELFGIGQREQGLPRSLDGLVAANPEFLFRQGGHCAELAT
ncbi:hypothetical protein D3C83_156100 [compost metagenome]